MTEQQKKLVEKNINLARKCASKFGNKNYDDVFSVACEALCVAAQHFDISKGYAFSTYAYPCIMKQIYKYFNKEMPMISSRRHGVWISAKITSLNDQLDENDKYSDEKITMLEGIYTADDEIYIKDFIETLSQKQKNILLLRLKGLTQIEIGKIISSSQTSVSKILYLIKDKWKRYNDEYIIS